MNFENITFAAVEETVLDFRASILRSLCISFSLTIFHDAHSHYSTLAIKYLFFGIGSSLAVVVFRYLVHGLCTMSKAGRKRKRADFEKDKSPTDAGEEIISETDRLIFQEREKELQQALLGKNEQIVCVQNVVAEIARGKVVVRELDQDHVNFLTGLMENLIVEKLLYFRCFVETGQDIDTDDGEVVKRIVQEIQAGTRKVFFLSGIHRFKAIQNIQPNYLVKMDIYDAKKIAWSTGQYVATRDNTTIARLQTHII